MVLCFENDGHIALETSINGICSDSFQRPQTQLALTFQNDSLQGLYCKRCVDVPVSIDNPEHLSSNDQVFQAPIDMPVMMASEPISLTYLDTATEGLLPNPPPFQPSIHRFLNTVVLLI